MSTLVNLLWSALNRALIGTLVIYVVLVSLPGGVSFDWPF